MSEKVSFKPISIVSLIFGIGLILYSCMTPVDINAFLDDDTVKEAADNNLNPGFVKIDTVNSDSGLTAGNRKINGIKAGLYYKIEEIEDGKVVGINFVKANGSISDELKDIRKISSGTTAITGLINDVMYRVKSAQAYPNDIIQYFKLDDTSPKSATVASGTVTISESRSPCYFDVSLTIDVNKFYDVINVGIWTDHARTSAKRLTSGSVGDSLSNIDDINYERHTPSLPNIGIFQHRTGVTVTPSILNGKSIMELPANPPSVNNYVFVEDIADGSTKDFYYLTVNVNKSDNNGNITITPPASPTNEPITLTYSGGNISEGQRINILWNDSNVANRTIAVTNTNTTACTYTWYKDESATTQSSTGNTITINSTTGLTSVGIYKITVEVTIGGVDYSKWFILEIK